MLRSNGVRLLRSLPAKFVRHADEPVLDNPSTLSLALDLSFIIILQILRRFICLL